MKNVNIGLTLHLYSNLLHVNIIIGSSGKCYLRYLTFSCVQLTPINIFPLSQFQKDYYTNGRIGQYKNVFSVVLLKSNELHQWLALFKYYQYVI